MFLTSSSSLTHHNTRWWSEVVGLGKKELLKITKVPCTGGIQREFFYNLQEDCSCSCFPYPSRSQTRKSKTRPKRSPDTFRLDVSMMMQWLPRGRLRNLSESLHRFLRREERAQREICYPSVLQAEESGSRRSCRRKGQRRSNESRHSPSSSRTWGLLP